MALDIHGRKKARSVMDVTDRRVAQKIAEFDKKQDPVLLREASELIDAAERDAPPGDRTQRKAALARRLRFVDALDRLIDPAWDPEKKPVKGAPRPSSYGVVYPSGEVDPSMIPDPAERAEYERALKASKDYERWYDLQYQLRQINERAVRFGERFVAERYAGSAASRQELEELLAESSVSDEWKQRLRAMVTE